MWVFTKHGFFSAVQNYNNSEQIHVRARFRGDLERLCKSYGIKEAVVKKPGTDYPYRMDFERTDCVRIMACEAEAIDYDSFKDAVHDGTVRDSAYLKVWSTLRHAQN